MKRLLENWLDSVNERAYQPVFLQLLLAEGHQIVHSTRHSPIEFGKDVVSIGTDGTVYAYQLKGNPGGRLSHSQYRDIAGQIDELCHLALAIPGLEGHEFTPVLVTNGEIDEEVQRVVGDYNRALRTRGRRELVLMQRGWFLDRLSKVGTEVWPRELAVESKLISLLAADGESSLDLSSLEAVLIDALEWGGFQELSSPASARKVAGAAVLAGVALKAHSVVDNHWELLKGWTVAAMLIASVCEKRGDVDKQVVDSAISGMFDEVTRRLVLLIAEAKANKEWIGHDGLGEVVVHPWRRTLIVACCGLLALMLRDDNGEKEIEELAWARKVLAEDGQLKNLWGEGAIPQFVCMYIARVETLSGKGADRFLDELTTTVVRRAMSERALASPYYDYEQVFRRSIGLHSAFDPRFTAEDSFKGSSFMAAGLLVLMVRAGLKQSCKYIWPDFTRIGHRRFELKDATEFGLQRAKSGMETVWQPPLTMQWSDLEMIARDCRTSAIPRAVKRWPVFVLLYCIVYPHRMSPSVLAWLGGELSQLWFIDEKML